MRILAVSDQEVDQIYDLASQGQFRGIQAVVACGDLQYDYLENLVTLLNVDLFFVPGNHDPIYDPGLVPQQAAGCINLDLGTARTGGLLLAGFGGSIRYRPDGDNQYTQAQAFARAVRLLPRLRMNQLRFGRALDVLITHSPPFGIHDDGSSAHQGLKAITWLMRSAKPRYVIHGHMHNYNAARTADADWQGISTVMNVYPYRVIEIGNAK